MHTSCSVPAQSPQQHSLEAKPGQKSRPRPPLFRALGRQEPPDTVEIAGAAYRRVRVFKHDSWAATALYEGAAGLVICKFQRQQAIGLLPMKWFGRRLARHESALYQRLAGLPGIPQLLGEVTVQGQRLRNVVAHTFIVGHPLGKDEKVNDAFFPTLEKLLAELHRRQVAYVDLHKRENIIVGEDGQPYLIDFQIGFALPHWWPGNSWPLRLLLRVLQGSDTYHLRKHYARCRPDQCGYDLSTVAAKRPWWIRLHRLVGVPFRTLRRNLLILLGIRSRSGHAHSEHFTEEALRVEMTTKSAA